MSVKILTQQTETEATDTRNALQAAYVDAEIEGALIAKKVQIDGWTAFGIPLARSVAFEAASIEDQTKYALISTYASSGQYADLQDYSAAWELEFTKMFG